MKKLLMAVAVIGLLGFAGIQMASAHGGYGQGGGYGYCGQYDDEDNSKDNTAWEEFRTETNDIRRSIVVKRSELRALQNQDNPDAKRVAQLTGELFDLQNDLDKKAADKGITGRSNYGHGPGRMWGNGYRNDGRHMMDW
jgi:hypothetical protein